MPIGGEYIDYFAYLQGIENSVDKFKQSFVAVSYHYEEFAEVYVINFFKGIAEIAVRFVSAGHVVESNAVVEFGTFEQGVK